MDYNNLEQRAVAAYLEMDYYMPMKATKKRRCRNERTKHEIL